MNKWQTNIPTCSILGVNVAVIDLDSLLKYMNANIDSIRGKYITVANVHTTVTAFENSAYQNVQNQAAITLPDGGPLSTYQRKHGFDNARRVTGPDFMKEVFLDNKLHRHFFFGSTQETLSKLERVMKTQYPNAQVCGMYSPPFRKLSHSEELRIVSMINDSNPDYIWIGLGAPKQENWMLDHEDQFSGVMVGVGAGFDYFAGNIKRAPQWMQDRNLEWLYRLFQEPKRLFKRYFTTNIKYLYYTKICKK